MKTFTIFILIAFIAYLAIPVQAKFYLTIDNFITSSPPLILSITVEPADPLAWYSPYGEAAGTPPLAAYRNTDSALGGQRDFVIGYEGSTPSGSVAIMSISQRRCSIAFPENYAGGAYAQWDGDDFLGVDPIATPFPGSTLNQSPGLGAHVNTTPYSERNADDISVDFTSGGRAYGIFISISVDHDQTEYYMDAFDVNGVFNTIQFFVDVSPSGFNVIFHRYDAPGWSSNANSLGFDWTKVVAFQVRLWTFEENGVSQAVDSSFAFLNTFGYVITVTVELDCQCEGIEVTPVEGELITLQIQGSSTILGTYQSDVNGVIEITEDFLDAGITYRLCLVDLSTELCSPTSGCLTVVLNAFQDSAVLTFTLAATPELYVPDDVSYPCDYCQFPDGSLNCPEFGLTTTCDGTIQRADYTDVRNVNTCATVITRTWSNEFGQTGVQVLTFSDQEDPTFNVLPRDLVQDCSDVRTSLTEWLDQDAFALGTDLCTPTFITNDWDLTLVGSCDSIEVNFVVNDACLHRSLPESAVYEIFDDQPPTVTVPASDSGVECNLSGSSNFGVFNGWLGSNGLAQATDVCSNILWTNNYVVGSFQPGCFEEYVVTFTPEDSCGNVGLGTTASFVVEDNTPPTIVNQPSNPRFQCDPTTNGQSVQNYLDNFGGASATDACSLTIVWALISQTTVIDTFCLQEQDIIFRATDNCGISTDVSGTITIEDTSAPFFVVEPLSSSAECSPTSELEYGDWLTAFAGAEAADLCNTASLSSDFLGTLDITCGERRSVQIIATDDCGLQSRRTVSFTIQDNEDPRWIVQPQNAVTECNGDSQQIYTNWLESSAGASGEDDCSLTQISYTTSTLQFGCDADTTVRFFLTDECGNSISSTATFTVEDREDPYFIVLPEDLILECDRTTNQASFNRWVSLNGNASGDDECTSVFFTFSDPGYIIDLNFGCSFSQDFTFTINDQCGRTDSSLASVIITDENPPRLLSPASDRIIECNGDPTVSYNQWLSVHGGAIATDTCGDITWSNTVVPLVGDACSVSATVVFTAEDECGFSVQTTAEFSATDSLPPVISPQARSESVECDPTSNENQFRDWVLRLGGAVATDQCSSVTWSGVANPAPIGCDEEIVRFRATDECGLFSETVATFEIVDTVRPTFNPPASNLVVVCDDVGTNTELYDNWVDSRGGAVAVDVCALSLTWSNNAPEFPPFNCGSQSVSFVVEDECGNRATTIATYTVTDDVAPIFINLPSDATAECDSVQNPIDIATWILNHGGGSATDNCTPDDSLIWTTTVNSLVRTQCGQIATVTFTVTDGCGSSNLETATFTVVDTTAPTLTRPAGHLVVECGPLYYYHDDIDEYLASLGGASAFDTCTDIVWRHDFVVAPNPCTGPLDVTFRATDECGNFIETVGTITVTDTIPPIFVDFPLDVVLECDESTDSSFTGYPDYYDECEAEVDRFESDFIEVLPYQRHCPGDTVITRTWKLVDSCGNIAEQDQVIVIKIPVGPCIPVPCTPCDELPLLCCESTLKPIPCNPVECLAVLCEPADCSTVPCLPVVCTEPVTTVDDDDDIIAPSPVPDPTNCAPIYVYVFDDDDGVVEEPIRIRPQNVGSSSNLHLSFLLIFIILVSLF